jgi:hypothetical protein
VYVWYAVSTIARKWHIFDQLVCMQHWVYDGANVTYTCVGYERTMNEETIVFNIVIMNYDTGTTLLLW